MSSLLKPVHKYLLEWDLSQMAFITKEGKKCFKKKGSKGINYNQTQQGEKWILKFINSTNKYHTHFKNLILTLHHSD